VIAQGVLQNSEPVDAVLMDMQMPSWTLRSGPHTARAWLHRPIIRVDGQREAATATNCLQRPAATDHSAKPIDGHHLIQLIAKHLSSAGQDSTKSFGFRGIQLVDSRRFGKRLATTSMSSWPGVEMAISTTFNSR